MLFRSGDQEIAVSDVVGLVRLQAAAGCQRVDPRRHQHGARGLGLGRVAQREQRAQRQRSASGVSGDDDLRGFDSPRDEPAEIGRASGRERG